MMSGMKDVNNMSDKTPVPSALNRASYTMVSYFGFIALVLMVCLS